ncbi:diguanylate cyclase/phosphodiesterase [Streptomyces lincolnensis]|uniref:Diguanylate cyclase/phosphodiesterase n=1 Tax=Streptomyces lincolnensis TaxID=1915 RepID=A0A1B1MKQ7_STRLN|nr:diguanylate cyclase [Streptomyces lincolnensis]ANS69158.1 diguanylate cyclase/phosphodiesterase [Streptomyces lincolnensis]AXG58077.1 diguanylate cyclase/phosphodiesterase [Streptomyces lincolnensis]
MIGGRDRAAEIAATGTTVDVGDATTRYLLYGLLPSWFVPGLADWAMHRRTRIEDTAGTKESLIHSLMMAEVGIPIAFTLRYEVNPLLLIVQLGGAAVHEATALWDVKTAVDSDREVRPVEQHIHSFLESLPFGALASLMCLHADQVGSLLRGGRGDPDAWRLVPRRRPLSRGYLAGIGLAIGTCVLLPYGEELLRCARTARRNRKHTRDEAKWQAKKAEKGR